MTDQCMTPNDPCADPDSCTSVECARDRLHVTLRDEADQRESHLPECREYRWNTDANACICPALYRLAYIRGAEAERATQRQALAAIEALRGES